VPSTWPTLADLPINRFKIEDFVEFLNMITGSTFQIVNTVMDLPSTICQTI